MEPIAISPDGTRIIGTLERIEGRADILNLNREYDGSISFGWAGSTEIFWDSQRTAENDKGEQLFLDENGNEWVESQLIITDEETLEIIENL